MVEHLLSQQKLRQLTFAIEEYKRQKEPLEIQHRLISKYAERLWFQRSMQMNYEELIQLYHKLARTIYALENDISAFRGMIYMHGIAIEELHHTMDPFKGLNMKEVTLVQQNLF